MPGRQFALYRAANAAGFATVWHDENHEAPAGLWNRILTRLSRLFG